MQKLSRAVIGTNSVDNCSRYCQTPATMGLTRTVGYGGDSGSIHDLEKADLVIIVGIIPPRTHPGSGHARETRAQAAWTKVDRVRSP